MNQYLEVNEIKLRIGLQVPDAIGKYLTHLGAIIFASNTIIGDILEKTFYIVKSK